MSDPPGGRAAPSRAELAGLTLLVLASLLYWSAQYRPFTLPNNDYASFANTAASFADGALPKGFQRGPLLPALMALLGPLMPEPHPHLHAALAWNIAFSLGTLVLLYLFARPLLGAGALLVPTLFAATSQFHSMGLQPLVEPSLGFLVVLAFLLSLGVWEELRGQDDKKPPSDSELAAQTALLRSRFHSERMP